MTSNVASGRITWHAGRAWTGTQIEDGCPCRQEPCGLVDLDAADPACEHHPTGRAKTMRQGHPSTQCSGRSA